MESRVLELGRKEGRQELEEQWKALRRGWYVGNETFLDKLEAWLDKAVTGRKRESQTGGAREAHDEAGAERWLAKGLRSLGLAEDALASLPKGAPEKAALAWWLRGRTTVSLRWVTERLRMGQYTRVTQAISRLNRKPGRQLKPLRDRLLTLNEASA